VHVLNKQVEEVTSGAIPQKAMSLSLSIGVAVSVGLAMLRVLTGISIFWLLVPGYAIALAMTFFVPPIFTAIAFDSGGVASGPMATTILLPFCHGRLQRRGRQYPARRLRRRRHGGHDALITIQALGLIYKRKLNRTTDLRRRRTDYNGEIIDYAEEAVGGMNTVADKVIELMVTIVDRGKGANVVDLYRKEICITTICV
jgi:hypothetical protein